MLPNARPPAWLFLPMHRLFAVLALPAFAMAQAPRPADPDANAPAASPAQNRKPQQLPPPGIPISDEDRAKLLDAIADLAKDLDALKSAKLPAGMAELIPDVEIFHKAADWALRYDEFYNPKEIATALELLKEGKARAAALREGTAPWTTKTGPVARGYRSKIDGSVQPYGVVVPPTWKGSDDKTPRATWIWNHGRGDTLTELAFTAQRMKSPGEFVPEDTFVVHPYGRYCNATKFAGETDVFEALAAARRAYPVDGQRLVNAGFSMGGASAWHLGVHHPGLWAVTHAGAGFAETAEYAGVFAPGKTPPPWWEQILWRWYDATASVANFSNHPVLAYHGEQDKQGQATQIMKRFAEKEGVAIQEFVGPGVGHKYEPKTKKEIAEKIAGILAQPRTAPRKIRLTAYAESIGSAWLNIVGIERYWERADVDAEIKGDTLSLTTKNVSLIYISADQREKPAMDLLKTVNTVVVDGQTLGKVLLEMGFKPKNGTKESGPLVSTNLVKKDGKWQASVASPSIQGNTKFYSITGPIDHAFMDSFLFVKPTGAPLSPALGAWTQREFDHATRQWRGIFRGVAPAIDDTKLTDAQIAGSNLILWGDPSSNAVLKRIAGQLPVKWTSEGVEFGGKKYGPSHVPILIFPNPLNREKYVVLNSGFTFSRSSSSGTNSQQTPKLPDWAIIDTSVPPDDKFPGKVVDAGFFDAHWKYTEDRPK